MRHLVLSLASAALAAALTLAAPGVSAAGDPYAYGTYENDYGGDWSGDGGWYDNVRRDGNVFYNAYNSYDGYDRHRYYGGYWERPYDGYDCGCYGGGYYGGYDQGYYGGYSAGYPRRNGKLYYPDYGNYDPSHHAIRRDERRIECEANGGRFYAGRCY